MKGFDPRELGRKNRPSAPEEPPDKGLSFSPVEAAALLFELGRFGFKVFQGRRAEWQRVEHAVLRLADERCGCLSALDVVSALEVPLDGVKACLEHFAEEGHCRREEGGVYVFDRFLPRFCDYCGGALPREWEKARLAVCEGCGSTSPG